MMNQAIFISCIMTTMFCPPEKEKNCDRPPDPIQKYQESVRNAIGEPVHRMSDTVAVGIEYLRLRDVLSKGNAEKEGEYFLGYLSERWRVTLPRWWVQEFHREIISPSEENTMNEPLRVKLWKENDEGWKFNGFEEVSVTPDGLRLKEASRSLLLQKVDFYDGKREDLVWSNNEGDIAGECQDGFCAVAFGCPSGGLGGPPFVYGVDAASGKPIWKQKFQDGLIPGTTYGGGVWGSYTRIVVDDDRVIVWCAYDFSLAVEIFDKRDGTRKASFVTSYLDRIRRDDAKKKKE